MQPLHSRREKLAARPVCGIFHRGWGRRELGIRSWGMGEEGNWELGVGGWGEEGNWELGVGGWGKEDGEMGRWGDGGKRGIGS
uniref:Uncharacterized protein n=1 Tax=Desertifilum tharense IPPAS B-1220 TaxID=1781255 RepID=A0ACD5GSI5_9CYAN